MRSYIAGDVGVSEGGVSEGLNTPAQTAAQSEHLRGDSDAGRFDSFDSACGFAACLPVPQPDLQHEDGASSATTSASGLSQHRTSRPARHNAGGPAIRKIINNRAMTCISNANSTSSAASVQSIANGQCIQLFIGILCMGGLIDTARCSINDRVPVTTPHPEQTLPRSSAKS